MVMRGTAAGMLTAERSFRRIQGHRQMPQLVDALHRHAHPETATDSEPVGVQGMLDIEGYRVDLDRVRSLGLALESFADWADEAVSKSVMRSLCALGCARVRLSTEFGALNLSAWSLGKGV